MKFNTAERINLISICRAWAAEVKTDFVSMKVMKDFMGVLGFEQEEIDRLKFEVKPTGTSWNRSEDKEKEIKTVDRVKEIVKEELAKYDKEKQLNFLKHFSLCEKFNYEPQEEPEEETKIDKKVEKK